LVCALPIPEIRRCGTRGFAADKLTDVNHEIQLEKISDEFMLDAVEEEIKISVYWHVITSANGTMGNIREKTVRDSLNVLTREFAPAFSFHLAGVDYTDQNEWFDLFADLEDVDMRRMKRSLKLGGMKVLNIYSTTLLDGVIGISSFPQDYAKNPTQDGVVIHFQTLPGGSYSGVNQGKTLVHEVGHWLGLYHIFEGGCSFPNDFVEDTRPQADIAVGCKKYFI
jgi:hypothetical protein